MTAFTVKERSGEEPMEIIRIGERVEGKVLRKRKAAKAATKR
jgi:hypothetical protein